MDVMLVVDGSASIGATTFNGVLKSALISLANELFNLGKDIKLGLTLFSHNVNANISLSNDFNFFKTEVQKLIYPKGGTRTYKGIRSGIDWLKRNGRSNANPVSTYIVLLIICLYSLISS